jgi:hypothetical protein
MFCVNYVTIVSFVTIDVPKTWNLTMLQHCYCVGVTIDVPEFLSLFLYQFLKPENIKTRNLTSELIT